uniref:Uncharacterized protein n=1 Tax=Cucumis melo TaxID=3656 RepID=A0A9I9E245_CUCME
FSRPGVKSGPPTVSSLCSVLVISLSIFGSRAPRTSTHTPGMLPDTFSGGIGREASSLEGELWCDPKRSKRWPKLPTSGERSSGVRNHWKCTCGPKDGRSFQRVANARPVSETTGNALAAKETGSSWGKKRSPDGFFPLLRIGH